MAESETAENHSLRYHNVRSLSLSSGLLHLQSVQTEFKQKNMKVWEGLRESGHLNSVMMMMMSSGVTVMECAVLYLISFCR